MKSKYPFTKQEGLKDCGAASLQMIIKYYQGYVNLDKLNEMLLTNKNGTNAYNLVEVAKKLGFEAYGVKISLDDIKKAKLILPFIIHTTIDEKYNHFMVVYKIDFKKQKVIVGDPQIGIRTMKFIDFEKIYNNVCLILYPLKPIIRENEFSIKDFFNGIFKKYFKEIKILFFISLILILFSLVTSFYVKILFDNINFSIGYLNIIFLIFMFMNVFKIIANYLRTKILIYINKKISFEFNMDACKKVINLPYRYYKNKTTGEVLSRLLELEKIRDVINKISLVLFVDLPLAITSSIVLVCINFKLFVISLVFLLLYVVVLYLSKNNINRRTENCYKEKANYISYLEECIGGFETIKGLNLESKVVDKCEINYIKYLKNTTKLDEILNLQITLKDLISTLSDIILVFFGILFVKSGDISIGNLLAFNSMQVFFFSPIRNIIDLDFYIIEAKKILRKVYEMFEDIIKRDIVINDIRKIEIRNLNYEYSNKKVLKNTSLTINSGDKIMILGRSGSGKSTLLKILMGYLNVERGKVMMAGHDINDINNLRERIIYISQNEMLFTDSIKNNVELFDDSDFNIVAKDCFLEDIVNMNQLGYNMVIEENGFNISGGQKQRIVLARAMMKDFDVLLIDEGLNQVDINLERRILKNIFARYKDKIIIIVSHRKDNVDLYDKVIEFKKGKIIRKMYKNERYRYL